VNFKVRREKREKKEEKTVGETPSHKQ